MDNQQYNPQGVQGNPYNPNNGVQPNNQQFYQQGNNAAYGQYSPYANNTIENGQVPKLQKNSAKKRLMVVVIIIAVVLAAGAASYFMFFTPEKRVERSLSLGEQYLKDKKYEDAIVAYNAVIKIDEKQIKAYEGLLTANKELKHYDKAIDSMETAINVLGQDQVPADDIKDLVDVYKLGADEAESNGDTETAEKYWNRVSEIAPDDPDALAKKQYYEVYDDLNSDEYKADLDNIAKGVNAEDWDSVFSVIASDSFQSLLQKIQDYGITDKYIVDTDDGKVGIYKGRYIYCGDYNGDIREGNGVWLLYNSDGDWRHYAKTSWSNDLPNGQTVDVIYTATPREEYALRVECNGNVKDGLWDGNVVSDWTSNDGTTETYNDSFSNGVLENYVAEESGYHTKSSDGRYIVYSSLSDNGIWGFPQSSDDSDDSDSE